MSTNSILDLPFSIDFNSQKNRQRQQCATTKNEGIAKAVGLKKNTPCTIIDATAGFGTDAFILASLGAQLTLLERSAHVFALLEDALARQQDPNIQIRLIHIDACDYLQTLPLTESPDVIYCDPMFPTRKKSALVKKQMQYLQALLKTEFAPDNNQTLLTLACQHARKRVVVKRPILAPYLSSATPDFSYRYKSHRFDIYLTKR